jgi:hypothetical protein
MIDDFWVGGVWEEDEVRRMERSDMDKTADGL